MAAITPPNARFSRRLRQVLDDKRMSNRHLARVMAPDNPELMRRNIARWLGGYNEPSRLHLVALAEALDVPLSTFESDDEDEEADPVSDLFNALSRFVDHKVSHAATIEVRDTDTGQATA